MGKSLSVSSSSGFASPMRSKSPSTKPREPPAVRSTHSAELRQKLAEVRRDIFDEEKRRLWGWKEALSQGSMRRTASGTVAFASADRTSTTSPERAPRESQSRSSSRGPHGSREETNAVGGENQQPQDGGPEGGGGATQPGGVGENASIWERRPRSRAGTEGAIQGSAGTPGSQRKKRRRGRPQKDSSSTGRPNTAPSAVGDSEDVDGLQETVSDTLKRPATTFTSAVRAAMSDLRRGESHFRIQDGNAALVKDYWRTPPGPRTDDPEDKPDAFTAMKLRDLGIGGNGQNWGLGWGDRWSHSWHWPTPGPGEYDTGPKTGGVQPAAKYHNQPQFTMGVLLPLPQDVGKKPMGGSLADPPRMGGTAPLLVMLNPSAPGPGPFGSRADSRTSVEGQVSGPSCEFWAKSAERRPVCGKRQQHGYH